MMKIIKENERELEFVVENEKPTIFMLLKEELDKDPDVLMAAWREDHPLLKNIYFYVRTNNKNPRSAILEALERILKRISDFEKEYNKLFK